VAEHNFNVEDLDVHSKTIGRGAMTTVMINAPAGECTYYCGVRGHKEAGMVDTLRLESRRALTAIARAGRGCLPDLFWASTVDQAVGHPIVRQGSALTNVRATHSPANVTSS